ncbi:hypothetical protein GGS23DRAFT_250246 [Durotheca rogersii]|uniref:uncharacterized protein n=1 Tax=Durotheca rogersii TaxID=419775 RepID=UPI00221EE9B8|nr:uncharacterized protein GGS23DRAFT_250246 [Durotheca rogersii]KAI5860127.1 hypothetical protein GGS23DRAFT_250246 [Durotheca rogersii]
MPRLPARSLSDEDSPEAKRRKIRKGTHSCWECESSYFPPSSVVAVIAVTGPALNIPSQRKGRRRKVRCQFASTTATICVGCEARRTPCVSQEFPNEQPQAPDRGLSQRLSRIEGLLEMLVTRIAPNAYIPGARDQRPFTSSDSVEDDELDSSADVLRPSAADHPPIMGIFDALQEDGGNYASGRASFVPTPASTQSKAAVTVAIPTMHAHISKALHAAFPCQHDIDAILAAGPGAFFIVKFFNGVDGPSEPPSALSEIPPVTSHPALLAKRLIQLTNCMQKLSPSELPLGLTSKEPIRAQMNRMVSIVSELVASNDDLVGSVEGLEALHLVALYHANAGNLRKSWLASRRVIAVAQLMGVDRWARQGDDKPLRSVDPRSDPSTRTRADGLWHRLNFSDRYLSLLLGLPATILDDGVALADLKHMSRDGPSEVQLEKLHSVIAGAIIKRNASNGGHGGGSRGTTAADAAFGATQAIDRDLEIAAKSMGAQWWRPVEVPAGPLSALAPIELVRAHSHVMLQMNHHHLLILLHLPYMMRDPKERRWDYSKTTCLASSRELLRAYLVFRRLSGASSACRHTDYGALTAAMTLLLGYLDPKLRARPHDGRGLRVAPAAATIARQRALDRELVLAVRDTMKEMADRDGDKLSQEASDIISRLLPLTEVDMAATAALPSVQLDAPVRLEIPYLGTVNINPVRRWTPHEQHQPGPDGSVTPSSTIYGEDYAAREDTYGATDIPEKMLSEPPAQHLQPAPSSFLASLGGDANFPFMQIEPDLSSQYQSPELAADMDRWTFQGFDAAFFESLVS